MVACVHVPFWFDAGNVSNLDTKLLVARYKRRNDHDFDKFTSDRHTASPIRELKWAFKEALVSHDLQVTMCISNMFYFAGWL